MSNGGRKRYPVLATILIALLLAIVPLPEQATAYRPDFVVLTFIYWAMLLPRTYSVGRAWLAGLVLDVTLGTLLGQHALALCLIIYITVKLHLQIRVFPMLQMTATVFAALALYQFILFWVNGVAGVSAPAVTYWGPVLTGTAVWPVLHMVLGNLQYRMRPQG